MSSVIGGAVLWCFFMVVSLVVFAKFRTYRSGLEGAIILHYAGLLYQCYIVAHVFVCASKAKPIKRALTFLAAPGDSINNQENGASSELVWSYLGQVPAIEMRRFDQDDHFRILEDLWRV